MIRVKLEAKPVTRKRNVTPDRNAPEATVTPSRNATRQKAWRERMKRKRALVDIWADFYETANADG